MATPFGETSDTPQSAIYPPAFKASLASSAFAQRNVPSAFLRNIDTLTELAVSKTQFRSPGNTEAGSPMNLWPGTGSLPI